MSFSDLREFIDFLQKENRLKIIEPEVKMSLEVTQISQKLIEKEGPSILIENPIKTDGEKSEIKVLANLFGTTQTIADAISIKVKEEGDHLIKLRQVGKLLARLRHPKPPTGLSDLYEMFPMLKAFLNMGTKKVKNAEAHEIQYKDDDINIYDLPLQKCWPEDIAPLITWGIVVTEGPTKKAEDSFNLGIYRLQPIAKNKLIVRWLKHRGGALHFKKYKEKYNKNFPISVVIGCDPATILSAVTPIPDNISEYQFAGILRGSKSVLTKCLTNDLLVPAKSEIVIEGYIDDETAQEGPYGDHTGYYNSVEEFPVMTITAITTRKNPIYLTTHTGKPPDEPSVLGVALNEIFIPLLQEQYPEIVDFYLPPEGCSYRIAVISIKKKYPGHGRQIMLGAWSFLRQFMYTKWIIIVDDDIDCRNWKEVMWAVSTKVDPKRDTIFVEQSAIDYLDFSSPLDGLGSKIGVDATDKMNPETTREWGEKLVMDDDVVKDVDDKWSLYGLD